MIDMRPGYLAKIAATYTIGRPKIWNTNNSARESYIWDAASSPAVLT